MNLRSTPLAATLFSTLAALQPTAYAQTPQAESTLPEVTIQGKSEKKDFAPYTSTIGGKTPTAIRDIPQSVTVVNRSVLDSQAATSINDALRNVPGITISAGEGGQIGDNINLRGFSARTDIFMDGVRDRGQYARDTFFLDSVEVLKGSSSMQFGRGSTGGVINQVSKKARLKPHAELGVMVGTDDFYRSTLDVNQPLSESAAIRVSAFGQDVKSTRDVVENQDAGAAASLRFGIGSPTEVTLSALIQRNRDIPDYGFPVINGKPIDVPGNQFYGFTDDKFNQDVNVLTGTVEHKFNSKVKLRNQLQYSDYKTIASPTTISLQTGTTAPAPGTPLSLVTNYNYNTRDRVLNQSSIYNQTDLIIKADIGATKHTVTTGFEVGRDDYDNETYTWTGLGAVNLANPSYGPKPAGASRSLTTTADSSSNALGVYINDQIDLTPQWKAVAGIRWDRYKTDYQSTAVATGISTPYSRTDTMTSVRGGLIWQPSETQSYYVSYGTSFNPSAETDTLSAANAPLDPEKNRSYELGAKWDLMNGKVSFNSSIFQIEKTNARTTFAGTTTLDGNVRVRGFEVGAVGRITPNWQILTGYTFLNGKVTESRNPASVGKTYQNTPRHSLSLWSIYDITPTWEVGGGLVHTSDRYTNSTETSSVDSYTRVDATVAYKQKSYDIRLNLQNITNSTNNTYFETASGGRATPAKGRGAIVSAVYRF